MDLSLLQRRIFKDKAARWVMLVLTVLSLLLLIAIGIGLFFKSRLILSEHSLWELLSGSAWKPLSGEFGFRNGFVDCHRVAHLLALGHFPDRICQFVGKTYRISHIRHFGRHSVGRIRCLGHTHHCTVDRR